MIWRPFKLIRQLRAEAAHDQKQTQIALNSKNTVITELIHKMDAYEAKAAASIKIGEAAVDLLRRFGEFEPTPTNEAAQRIVEVPESIRGVGKNHEVWMRWMGAAMLREGMDIQAKGEDIGDFYWAGDSASPTQIVINVRKAATHEPGTVGNVEAE